MPDKTSISKELYSLSEEPPTITKELQNYIDLIVEEIVLKGARYSRYKKQLQQFIEFAGIDFESFDTNIKALFRTARKIRVSFNDSLKPTLLSQAEKCYVSENKINQIIERQLELRKADEVARKAREEAERREREERERKARGERERKEREERERKAREEAERKAREEEKVREALRKKNKSIRAFFVVIVLIISVLEACFLGWWCIPAIITNFLWALNYYELFLTENTNRFVLYFIIGLVFVIVAIWSPSFRWWSLCICVPSLIIPAILSDNL